MRGVVGSRDSGQKTLLFCIGWFGSIFISYQQHRSKGKEQI